MAVKIFIDQGHNPQNPNSGAEGNGYREQDLVYYIGVELAALLNANGNFEARLSRNSPDEILGTSIATSLSARTSVANAWGANLFISIHANASDIVSATGCEAFVFSTGSVAYGAASEMLAGISANTGIPDRGVSARPTLYVLRATKMPATLVETGFITNPSEATLLAERPDLFAKGMYEGLLRFYGIA